jgi:hypothetical protein
VASAAASLHLTRLSELGHQPSPGPHRQIDPTVRFKVAARRAAGFTEKCYDHRCVGLASRRIDALGLTAGASLCCRLGDHEGAAHLSPLQVAEQILDEFGPRNARTLVRFSLDQGSTNGHMVEAAGIEPASKAAP